MDSNHRSFAYQANALPLSYRDVAPTGIAPVYEAYETPAFLLSYSAVPLPGIEPGQPEDNGFTVRLPSIEIYNGGAEIIRFERMEPFGSRG